METRVGSEVTGRMGWDGLGWNGMGWDKVMMDGRWEMGDGRWEMKDGRWEVAVSQRLTL